MATIHRLTPLRSVSGLARNPEPSDPHFGYDLKAEFVGDRCREIWADADLLALSAQDVSLSARLCALLVPIKARLDKEPVKEDGEYRAALRQLCEDLDVFVTVAAIEDVEGDNDEPPYWVA